MKNNKTSSLLCGTGIIALLGTCSVSVLFGEDGRNFAGWFDIRGAVDQGSTVQVQLGLKLFNFSGEAVTGATLEIEAGGAGFALHTRKLESSSIPDISIPYRAAVDVVETINVPLEEYEHWKAGGTPKLVISYTDTSGEPVRSVVELRRGLTPELATRELSAEPARFADFSSAIEDNTGTSSSTGAMSTLAGGGPNHLPALAANVPYPVNTAVDRSGTYYIAVPGQDRVFKVNTSGTLTVLAGIGFAGYSGNGGPAPNARMNSPIAIALDTYENAYIADTNNCVIRKVSASTGAITTFAGTSCGYSGDGGSATSAKLQYPAGIAVDGAGNLVRRRFAQRAYSQGHGQHRKDHNCCGKWARG